MGKIDAPLTPVGLKNGLGFIGPKPARKRAAFVSNFVSSIVGFSLLALKYWGLAETVRSWMRNNKTLSK